MAKLVILSEGMSGRLHELTVDKTTVGRVEGNTFQIAEPSISSHHCEVLLKGSEVVIRDLNSTNGTYINGERITESVLKPGQVLRLGQIELRLDTDTSAAPTAPAKKPVESTMVMQRGVSLNELEQGGRTGGFDGTSKGFAKKSNKVNRIFLGVVIIVGLVIVALLLWAFHLAK
jgi:pSer/pThr/pTyr-binding forkhead associated (FHA) protein